jgi:hypothetical protein
MMRSFFRRGLLPSSRHGFSVVSRFGFCQQILSADFSRQQIRFFVSRFRQQISLISRFAFCQQILSADFYGQQF